MDVRRLRDVCGKVIRRLLSLRVAAAFERWREGVDENKRARAIVMRALKRMQLGACAGAFSRWVDAACEMRAEREQADAAAQRSAAEDARKRAIVGKVLKVWGQRALSMSFGLWLERTMDVRRLRGVCGKVIRSCCVCVSQLRLRSGERVLMRTRGRGPL